MSVYLTTGNVLTQYPAQVPLLPPPQVYRGTNTGVFVGCMWLEYGELLTAHGAGGGAFVVTGNGLAFLAGRVSYAFGFTGPCVPTNTGAAIVAVQDTNTTNEHLR